MSGRRALQATGYMLAVLVVSGCSSLGTSAAATPDSLVGTWALEEESAAPEQPYVSFARDGSWSASDGCNSVRGEWDLGADGAITITSGPQTLVACDGAPLPGAVSAADRVEVRGNTLVIQSSNGAEVTELVRSKDPLVGPSRLPIGYWAEEESDGAAFLFISSKGSFSGSDGCNTLTGPWEMTDTGDIRFPATVSTEMFCEGLDAWLGEAVLGRAVGGVMTLQAEDGTVLGQLIARR